jgi:hypothetical protein
MTEKGEWLETKPRGWSAEISDLSDGKTRMPGHVECPGCDMQLSFVWFAAQRDRENEITHWTLRHSCGASMTIFND